MELVKSPRQLAEMIAFKGHAELIGESNLLGFERAVIEIMYIAQMQAIDHLNVMAEGLEDEAREAVLPMLETAALEFGAKHLEASVEARHTVLGYLYVQKNLHVPLEPPGEFPLECTALARCLAWRRTDVYPGKRETWAEAGKKIGEQLDQFWGSSEPTHGAS